MDTESLKLLRWLADVEAIKQLKHRYCGYCDAGYDPDRLAELFCEDAVWDGGPIGRHVGREAIRTFFKGSSQRVPFALHMVMNPVIEVDGDTATGNWYLWQPLVYRLPAGEEAWWLSARYDDVYRRTAEGWQFARVTLSLKMLAPYREGYGAARIHNVYAEQPLAGIERGPR